MDFTQSYRTLNAEQKRAVDLIDGPLLVLAGPGTGKTQLLSTRVANILRRTDAAASNILCLTFTESGAQTMRERLRGLIGDDAYNVTISTYHGFGSDIIKNYAEHFQRIGLERSEDIRLERPVDELTQVRIIEDIVAKLPFDSPLISARYYVKSVVSTISDLKQHLIRPDDLRDIAKENLRHIETAQRLIDDVVNQAGGISKKKAQKYAQYEKLLNGLRDLDGELIDRAATDLEEAHQEADEAQSPTPLREWKDAWLYKDENDRFTLTDPQKSRRMTELAKVYEAYERALRERAAYDFDDMILHAIHGLKTNDELRFNLQERYQYILLDEFQDTNPSQFELVKRIADHPVHEGRPNVMAVGDDDQAIFAFQGANVGNMRDFLQSFQDVKVINLVDNYRSHPDILHVAGNVAGQIEDRLHQRIPDIDKTLRASNRNLPDSVQVNRRSFTAEASENAWVAERITDLIHDHGIKPKEIAVLAPKHKILEGLVPFLKDKDIPITYEKRENILETEIVQGLRLCARLLDALFHKDLARANEYFPLVLSLPYWHIRARDIWKVNWQFAKRAETRDWAEIALETPELGHAVEFYLYLSATAGIEPLELTLDKLSGTLPVKVDGKDVYAPLKSHYFDEKNRDKDPLAYYEAISHLSVIRSRLRDHQANADAPLTLRDFLDLFIMYESAETPLINSHPIAQKPDSVQLMTAYKAKGLEFENVFLLQAHDDVWGSASRGGNNKLALPPNLEHIRYVNSSDDERRRLLFVAITRAKHNLYITSHSTKDSGKRTVPLNYLPEADGESTLLPEKSRRIIVHETDAKHLAADTEKLWQAGQVSLPADFRSLLAERLKSYQMNPTHLNTFVDLERGGPESFLVQTLLRFPQAPNASGEFGTAIHNTLEWYQNRINAGETPTTDDALGYYDKQLDRRYLTDIDREQARDKGHACLRKYLAARKDMFTKQAKAEVNFYSEGVVLGDAKLSGKIDRLEVDQKNKTVNIVDYKTGKPLTKWGSDMKSLKYKQQLYFYKLLIEGSSSWRDYSVNEARLEFVEADKNGAGKIVEPLLITFDRNELLELKDLIKEVWNRIMRLDLPDVDTYAQTAKDSKKFIKDLLA
ncbi:MAG: ATP-dependent DNA helicase [Candidatus Saccharibacteria bacterium]|nr:ATP-dependent DNA helicase [Candidatus Saccharibacteria bacterium]